MKIKILVIVLILILVFSVIGFYLKSSIDKNSPFQNYNMSTNNSTFTFNAAGDFGANENTTLVLSGIKQSKSDFTIALGDLSYDEISVQKWCDLVKGQVGDDYPFLLIAGNHDESTMSRSSDNFLDCFTQKVDGIEGDYGKQYYFDYEGLARFILISPDINLNGEKYDYTKGTVRYEWLSKTIDDAKNKDISWVIVGMHKNCISMGSKECEIGQDVLNLLIDKKVDLILQGHDHTYQRSKQIAFNSDCSSIVVNGYNPSCIIDDGLDNEYEKGNGAVLIITGTGGRELYKVNADDTEAGYFVKRMGENNKPTKGFVRFGVNEKEIKVEFVGVNSSSDFQEDFSIVDLDK